MEEKNSSASQSPAHTESESPASTEAECPEIRVVNPESIGIAGLLIVEEKNSSASQSPANTESESPANMEVESPVNTEAESPASPVVNQEAIGSGGLSGSTGTEIVVKKKRGRPRKSDAYSSNSISDGSVKRGRGRPKGSGKLQRLAALGGIAADTAGGNFTPHVVFVYTGEDITRKIISITQWGRHAICILSASGEVSSVVLRQPGSSGGILRYEGRFELLSLSGSFVFGERGTLRDPRGGLSVSLAKPDGRVFGGAIAGSLIAAGPVQLIVASFNENVCKKLRRRHSAESSTAVRMHGNSDVVRAALITARATDDDDNCTTPTSAPSEPAHEGEDDVMAEIQDFDPAPPQTSGENALQASQPMLDQRTSPDDINAGEPQI